MTERDLYAPLVHGLNAEGHAVCRWHDGAGAAPGDIVGVARDGRAVLVEVKIVPEGADLVSLLYPCIDFRRCGCSPHQAGWLRGYANRGGIALLVLHRKGGPTMAARVSLTSGTWNGSPCTCPLRREGKRFVGWGDLLD